MRKRVRIQWTATARKCLKSIPKRAAKGLIDKADLLLDCEDPKAVHKPLAGPLQDYFRITYGRYRAIYCVRDEELANGDVIANVIVMFVAAGIRKEGDKKDVYRLAKKILKYGGFGDATAVDAPEEDQAT